MDGSLETFVRLELGLFLGALIAVITYQMLVGKINTRGLLLDGASGSFSPGRVQLLVITMMGALWYVLTVAENPTTLPEVPERLLWVLGGSSGFYLGGKGSALFPFSFGRESQPPVRRQDEEID